ncbi:MAG TPA: pitrilysin family protein [Puia sp.]|nr:pitrilysin family protein [Puia sp.]
MKRIFFTWASALVSLATLAQPRLPENYYWEKMPNGLEVVVIENAKVPLVTIEIAVKNGAYTEGPEYSGLSHLFEHMFFKANQDYPDQASLLKRTQELGAIWNGTTGNERVNYFFTFDRDSLSAGLRFMNACIRFPIYRTEDMKKERPVVDGEFQRAESDPGFQLWLECQKKLWGDLITRKNPIGIHEVINTATPEKMMIIKNKYYFPNNSILVICGDVKHQDAFAKAEHIFGSWESSGFDPQVKFPIPEFPPLVSTEYFVKESSIAQTPLELYTWQGPDTRHDSAGTVAADVFFTILGMNSSKWQQALVDKGLTSFASANYQTEKFVGPVTIYLMPNPNKLKACNDEVLNQIKQWANDDYFTDTQLEEAKQVLRRDAIRQKEKPSAQASYVTYNWCSTSLDYMTDYESNLQKITRADIKQFVNRYITGKPYVAGMIINQAMNKKFNAAADFKPAL